MDDLISRKAAIRKICEVRCGCEPEQCGYDKYGCEYVKLLNKQPTVEAVPLEPLCVWLAGYAAPPSPYGSIGNRTKSRKWCAAIR